MLGLERNEWKWVLLWSSHHWCGEWGGDKAMNPKPIQELLLGTRVKCNNTRRGWHNVPSSFDLHCRKVWQREKIARWQLHASSHGGPLTRVERTSNTVTLKTWRSTCLQASWKTVGAIYMIQEWLSFWNDFITSISFPLNSFRFQSKSGIMKTGKWTSFRIENRESCIC